MWNRNSGQRPGFGPVANLRLHSPRVEAPSPATSRTTPTRGCSRPRSTRAHARADVNCRRTRGGSPESSSTVNRCLARALSRRARVNVALIGSQNWMSTCMKGSSQWVASRGRAMMRQRYGRSWIRSADQPVRQATCCAVSGGNTTSSHQRPALARDAATAACVSARVSADAIRQRWVRRGAVLVSWSVPNG